MTTRSIWTFESGQGVVGVERVDAKEELLPTTDTHAFRPTATHATVPTH